MMKHSVILKHRIAMIAQSGFFNAKIGKTILIFGTLLMAGIDFFFVYFSKTNPKDQFFTEKTQHPNLLRNGQSLGLKINLACQ
jgi:hypothetical protein